MMIAIWIVFGLIAGILAKWLLLPGGREGLSGTMLIGMTGALIGGVFAHGFGWHPGSHPEDLLLVILGTMLALIVYWQLIETPEAGWDFAGRRRMEPPYRDRR